jgi:hypothetical protein
MPSQGDDKTQPMVSVANPWIGGPTSVQRPNGAPEAFFNPIGTVHQMPLHVLQESLATLPETTLFDDAFLGSQ